MKKILSIMIVISFITLNVQAQEIRYVLGATVCCNSIGETFTANVIESRANNVSEWVMLESDYDGLDADCEDKPPSFGEVACGSETIIFHTHNLGADETIDPLNHNTSERWKLNGDYYQWGRKVVAADGPTDGTTNSGANFGSISGWNKTYATDNSWGTEEGDEYKNPTNDPCPDGYRIPSISEIQCLRDENDWVSVGTWATNNSSHTNYYAGYNIFYDMKVMFIPSAGYRFDYLNGFLYHRGYNGFYWTSSEYGDNTASGLKFDNNSTTFGNFLRLHGFSVRCITE